MQLKTNFHFHTSDDPKDPIFHSAYDAIDHAAKLGFGVLSFTCHQKFVYKKEYEEYAQKKDILLIPGIEAKIEKKDVVILNCDKKAEEIKTLENLRKYKKENPQIFVIAPHPFVLYPNRPSLGKKLEKNIDIFDAIEFSIFSNSIFNFNKKAKKIADKYKKPFIATSDTHQLKYLDWNYALINAEEKIPEKIFKAIKQKNFQNKTKTMNIYNMAMHLIEVSSRRLLLRFSPGNHGKSTPRS